MAFQTVFQRYEMKYLLTISDGNGKVLTSFVLEYSCALIIFSDSAVQKGESYQISIGSASGIVEAS